VTQARDQARREQAMARDATKRDQTSGVMFMPPTRHEPQAPPHPAAAAAVAAAAAASDSPDPARTGTRGSGGSLSQDSGLGLNYPGSTGSVHSSQDSSDGSRLSFGPPSNSTKEYPGSVPIVPQASAHDARHPVTHDGKPKPGHSSTDPLSATRHRVNVVSSERKGVSLGGDTSGMKDCKPSSADGSVPKGGLPQPPHNHKHSDKTEHPGRHRRHHENLLNPVPSSREDANSSGSTGTAPSTPYDKVMQEMSERRNREAFFERKEVAKLSEKHQAAAPYASSRQGASSAAAPVVKREPADEQSAKAPPPYHSASAAHRQGNPALAHVKRDKSPAWQAGAAHSRGRAEPSIAPPAQPPMQPPAPGSLQAHATGNRAISPLAKPASSQKSVPPHPSAALPYMMKPIKSEPQDAPPMTSRNGTLDEMDSRIDSKRIHTEEAAAPITPFANIKVEPKLPEQLATSYGPPYTSSSQPPVKSIFSPEKSATPHERESPYAQRDKLKAPSSDKGLGPFGSPSGSARGSKRSRTSSSSDSEVPTEAMKSEESLVKAELPDPSESCASLTMPVSVSVSVPVSVPVSMPVSVKREPSDPWALVTAPNGSLSQTSKDAKATKAADAGMAFSVSVKTEPAFASPVSNQVGGGYAEAGAAAPAESPAPAEAPATALSIKTEPLVPTGPLAALGSSQVDEAAGHHSHHKSKKKKEKKEKHKHKDKDREKNREEKKHKSKHKEKDKERKKELEASTQSVAPFKLVIKKPIEPATESTASGPALSVAPVESSSLKIKIPKERLQHVEPPPREPVVIKSGGLKVKIKCGDPLTASSATSSIVAASKESRKRDRSSPGDETASKVPKMVPSEQPKRSASGANVGRQNGLESRGMGRHQHKVRGRGGLRGGLSRPPYLYTPGPFHDGGGGPHGGPPPNLPPHGPPHRGPLPRGGHHGGHLGAPHGGSHGGPHGVPHGGPHGGPHGIPHGGSHGGHHGGPPGVPHVVPHGVPHGGLQPGNHPYDMNQAPPYCDPYSFYTNYPPPNINPYIYQYNYYQQQYPMYPSQPEGPAPSHVPPVPSDAPPPAPPLPDGPPPSIPPPPPAD